MGDRQPRRKTHARPARKTGGDASEIKMLDLMKFVAIQAFRNNCGLKIEGPSLPDHVHKGAVFAIGLDLPFELLTPSEQKIVNDLRREQCVCDADDTERVNAVRAEIAKDKKRERRDRAWSLEKWCMVLGVIFAAIALIWAVVWGVFVWLRPTR
jgi:hypothetical protein